MNSHLQGYISELKKKGIAVAPSFLLSFCLLASIFGFWLFMCSHFFNIWNSLCRFPIILIIILIILIICQSPDKCCFLRQLMCCSSSSGPKISLQWEIILKTSCISVKYCCKNYQPHVMTFYMWHVVVDGPSFLPAAWFYLLNWYHRNVVEFPTTLEYSPQMCIFPTYYFWYLSILYINVFYQLSCNQHLSLIANFVCAEAQVISVLINSLQSTLQPSTVYIIYMQ